MSLPPLALVPASSASLPSSTIASADQIQRDASLLASRSKANTGRAIRHAKTVLNASGQHVPTMTGESLDHRGQVRGISDQPAVVYAHTGLRVEEASWAKVFSAASDSDPVRYQTTQRASYDRDVSAREDARLAGGHRLGSSRDIVTPDYWTLLGSHTRGPQPTFQLAAHDRIVLEGTTSTYPLHPYHPQQIARRARSAAIAASRAAQPKPRVATAGGSIYNNASRSLSQPPLLMAPLNNGSDRSHRSVSGDAATSWSASLSSATRELHERQASHIASAALSKTRSAPSSSTQHRDNSSGGVSLTRFQHHMATTTGRLV